MQAPALLRATAGARTQRPAPSACSSRRTSPGTAVAVTTSRAARACQRTAPQQGRRQQRRGTRNVIVSAAGSPGGSSSSRSTATVAPAGVDDFATDQRPVILFDGVCNLCNGGVNFMLDMDRSAVYRLAALQSPAGRRLLARSGRAPDDLSSIVLVERDRHHIRSEAILRIGARLNVPLPLLAALGFPVPLPLRDALYDAVANNRYSFFGRTDACRLQGAAAFAERFIVE